MKKIIIIEVSFIITSIFLYKYIKFNLFYTFICLNILSFFIMIGFVTLLNLINTKEKKNQKKKYN